VERDLSRYDEHINVLAVHTATRPPLGADTWVHAQLIKALDRSMHYVHLAYVPTASGTPTPTHTAIESIDGLSTLAVDLGPEMPGTKTPGSMLRTLIATLPALPNMLKLAWYIRRHDIAILHTSDRPRDAFACVVLSKLTRARSIVHVHVMYNEEWMGRMRRWSIAHADARIAISEFVKLSLTRAGMSPDSTFVVLNAIDPCRWVPGIGRDEIRREFAIDPGAPVVITVCRLFKQKGTAELIMAVDTVRRELPDVRLLVVGHDPANSEPFLNELRSLVDELGLYEHVIFTGRRPDVPSLMAAADVFAMPSFEEPFGLVFAEALAMELPVVALDNGGTKEVLVHGRHGLLSDHGDLDALTGNLLTLLGDSELRHRMGAEGRLWVEDRFLIQRMASDTADVYRLVAS
jgi:glycosyltransferase involved in cell wall biosynthesis